MTSRRFGLYAAAATVLFAASISDRTVGAQQGPARGVSLTRATAMAVSRTTPPLDAWERRSRLVSVNAGALPNRATPGTQADAAAEITIELFDGASITATFDRFDPNESGVTWVGHVASQPGSLVTLVQGGGVLAGSIILPSASYTIRPAPRDASEPAATSDPAHVLVQINSSGFKSEAPPLVPQMSPASLEVAADEVGFADTEEFVDVLMVYTANAETWAGGPAGILNWLNLGISETNSAYAFSGVTPRVRLAYAERVGYSEVGSFSTNLNNLRAGAAGLSGVGALRNAYTADLVTMFVRPQGADACGIAFLMTNVSTAFAPNGFSVVDAPCSSPNGTLAHEFGHNMGLRHDWFMDVGVTPFTYAHGYVDLTARFRTIMAYPNACSAAGFTCTRLLAFSNPDMTQSGQPLGIPGGTRTSCTTGNIGNMSCDADERRALNNTALTVANFREFNPNRPPTIRTQPQSNSLPRGQSITLQVAADSLTPLTFQWYRGAAPTTATPIAGATGAAFTVVPGADGVWFERSMYWVKITNAIGSANSATATITMVAPNADAPLTQRRIADWTTAAARQGPGSNGSVAQPRARLGTSRGPAATPAAIVTVSDPVTPAVAPVNPGDDPGQCAAAADEVALAWMTLSRRESGTGSVAASLAQLMRALVTLDHPACRF